MDSVAVLALQADTVTEGEPEKAMLSVPASVPVPVPPDREPVREADTLRMGETEAVQLALPCMLLLPVGEKVLLGEFTKVMDTEPEPLPLEVSVSARDTKHSNNRKISCKWSCKPMPERWDRKIIPQGDETTSY